jgi:CheY-like chemotaxis protein
MRILIADDNAQVRKMLSSYLIKNGHNAETANDGKAAWKMLERDRQAFDLVFADIKMPIMNGLELLEKMRENDYEVPVIIMTGYAVIELSLKAFKLGAFDFLTKPFEFNSLLSTLNKIASIRSTRLNQLDIAKRYQAVIQYEIPSHTKYLHALIPALQNHYHPLCDLSRHNSNSIGSCLFEAVQNAIIYGSLEMDGKLREDSLGDFAKLQKQRQEDPVFCNRPVKIRAELSAERLKFEIEDLGNGFDPASLPDYHKPDSLMPSGRGLFIIRSYMDEVHWNTVGNCITMIKYLDRD